MNIHLACACDGSYAPHTGAMLQSLLATNPQHSFSIHVLFRDLADQDKKKLQRVADAGNVRLSFLPVPDAMMRPLPQAMFHPACWYRVFLADLLPQLGKILYLDSDLIVTDDIGPLWETDVSRHQFAAVINPLYPFLPYQPVGSLGLPDRTFYLNSGVLLMNLERQRARHIAKHITAYAQAHPGNPYPEQDALSALYGRECLQLHPRWNVQTTLYDLQTHELPFPPEQVAEALRRPAVIHFIGPFKPWVYLCTHPRRHLYFAARARTPWPIEPPTGRTLKAMLLRPLSLRWRERLVRMKRRARTLLA